MILINSIKAAKYTKNKFWFSTKHGKIATLFIGNKDVIESKSSFIHNKRTVL